MIIGARVLERLEAIGSSQAALARAIEVSPQAISKIVSGATRETSKLHQIARFLQTTPEYLSGETSVAVSTDVRGVAAEEDSETVEIDSIDLAYGMGGSFLDSDAVEVEKKRFPLSYIREFTESPPHLITIARGIGDSMTPTIQDRDVVLIDRAQTDISVALGDRIWAVVFGGIGMIKRVRPLPDGTVRLSSDNAYVSDEIATDGDLFIIGRVVGKSTRL